MSAPVTSASSPAMGRVTSQATAGASTKFTSATALRNRQSRAARPSLVDCTPRNVAKSSATSAGSTRRPAIAAGASNERPSAAPSAAAAK